MPASTGFAANWAASTAFCQFPLGTRIQPAGRGPSEYSDSAAADATSGAEMPGTRAALRPTSTGMAFAAPIDPVRAPPPCLPPHPATRMGDPATSAAAMTARTVLTKPVIVERTPAATVLCRSYVLVAGSFQGHHCV